MMMLMMMITMINARSLLLLGKNKSDFEEVINCVQKTTMQSQENLELMMIKAKSDRERVRKRKWKNGNIIICERRYKMKSTNGNIMDKIAKHENILKI